MSDDDSVPCGTCRGWGDFYAPQRLSVCESSVDEGFVVCPECAGTGVEGGVSARVG